MNLYIFKIVNFKKLNFIFFKKLLIAIIYIFPVFICEVEAQVIPDDTLGTESSTINSIDELRSRIEGGAIRGENLFHSFEEFGIPEGMEVFFANPEQIKHIFSRVTGSNVSEIFGTLGVEGAANLFLINPNGIIFGENTIVDIGGSFIATTAERIEFQDGNIWQIGDRNSKPILTWNAPIGLGLEETSGEIVVRGTGHNLEDGEALTPVIGRDSSVGFQVTPKASLALIGKNIRLENGVITAEEGQVELGGIKNGTLGLDLIENDLIFNYQNINSFGDIQLLNRSLIDTSGFENGSIKISGKIISIQNNSLLLNQNLGTLPSQSIELDASELIEMNNFSSTNKIRGGITVEAVNSGTSANIFLSAPKVIIDNATIANSAYGDGRGGNITVLTRNLSLLNGGSIGAITTGIGQGGDIRINSSDKISLSGASPSNGAFSLILSNTTGFADGGEVVVKSERLNLEDGGLIGTIARPGFDGIGGREGKAGDVLIDVEETIRLEGRTPVSTSSTILSSSLPFGDSGNLTVNAKNLFLRDGAALSVLSTGIGNAGKLSLNIEETLEINDGIVTASNEVLNEQLQSVFQLPPNATGLSGNLTIKTSKLNISNNGFILVRNGGIGDAGNLIIEAESINISQFTNIDAAALFGNGGNITIDSDRIQLENGDITASANDDGGNITIDAETFLALGDSDITATAVRGDGGDITISAEGLLGISERPAREGNGTSDIDASSQFGEEGTITIISPQINNRDPIIALRGIEPADNQEEIDYKCDRNLLKNQRGVYVGRTNIESLAATEENYFPTPGFVPPEEETNTEEEEFPVWQKGDPIIDSNAIRVDEKGDIYFVAEISPKQVRDLMCSSNQAELEREEK